MLRARKTSALLPLGHLDLIKHCLGKERFPTHKPQFFGIFFLHICECAVHNNVSESINLSKIEG
jgi:hypothetical protein